MCMDVIRANNETLAAYPKCEKFFAEVKEIAALKNTKLLGVKVERYMELAQLAKAKQRLIVFNVEADKKTYKAMLKKAKEK